MQNKSHSELQLHYRLAYFSALTVISLSLLGLWMKPAQAQDATRLSIFAAGTKKVTLKNVDSKTQDAPVLEYLATLNSPASTQGNPPLQATSLQVLKNQKMAFVTYHTAGEKIEGGLDLISFSNQQTIERLHHVHFDHTDYNDVLAYEDSDTQSLRVILAGNDEKGALISVFTWDSKRNKLLKSSEIRPCGYVVTDIALSHSFEKDRTVYGVSAHPGAIFSFNVDTLNVKVYDEVDHGLSVIPMHERIFAIAQFKVSKAMSLGQVFSNMFVPNYVLKRSPAKAPGRSAILGTHVYTNVGNRLRIFRTDDIPSHDHDIYLISRSKREIPGTPNGIDANGHHLMLAQGDAGVRYYSLKKGREYARYLGTFDFQDDRGSANDVRIEGNLVLVSDGLGGVRLLKILKH